jgi:hypothetical protein
MNLGILMWNTCNAKCAHCAVNSGPKERSAMTDEDIFSLIDACFYNDNNPKIGLSGGEAFVFFDRLCRIVKYATDRGAKVSINTNAFWATSVQKAVEIVGKLKQIALSRLVVSTDQYHEWYIPQERVLNSIDACKIVHLEVELQFVAAKNTTRLADFLAEHGDRLLNINCREIPCHPVGRAATEVPETALFLKGGVPDGLCPSAILSVSAAGNIIPCCNTAGHLPALQLGTISERLEDVHRRFLSSPLLNILVTKGPKALVEAAERAGYCRRENGYVDQCHLCYDLFRDETLAAHLKEVAADMMAEELYGIFLKNYSKQTGNEYPTHRS